MNNQTVTRTSKPAIFLSIICIFMIPIAGAFFLRSYSFINIIAAVSAAVLVLTVLINIVITLVLRNKLLETRKIRNEIMSIQKDMLADFRRYKRRIKLLAFISACYLAFLTILIICFNTAMFVLFINRIIVTNPILSPLIAIGLSAAILAYELMVFISAAKRFDTVSHGEVLSSSEYPGIFEIACCAAKKANIKNKFTLKADMGRNAGITKESDGSLTINIGIHLLAILNSGELYAVLLHEFAHAKNDVRASFNITRRCNKWQYMSTKKGLFPSFMFYGFSSVLNNRLSMFLVLSSYNREVAADKSITDPQDKLHAVNAFAKLEMGLIYDFSLPINNHYGDPGFSEQYLESERTRLVDSYNRNKKLWHKMALRQIQPLVNSHPSLPDRMKNLGVDSYDIDFSCADEKFNEDIAKLTAKINGYIKQETDWEALRAKNYSCYKDIVERYKSDPAFFADTYVVANAYYCLCDYESAEKLLTPLAEDKTDIEALFLLGVIKCARFDDDGVKDLFRVSDNVNYSERALQHIGLYLQYRGDQALIDAVKNDFNEKSAEFMDAIGVRDKRVLTENLPKDEVSKLNEFIRGFKNIDGALLLRKQSRKKILYVLIYNVFDENAPEIGIDNARLGRFIIKNCPHILLGGVANSRDFINMGAKFKYRIKEQMPISDINKLREVKDNRQFIDDNQGRIGENEVRLWQGISANRHSGLLQILMVFIVFMIIGGILGYIFHSAATGALIVSPVIAIAAISILSQMQKPCWAIVTEKKLVYKKNLYFWFNFNEIFDVKIIRNPIDYLLGTQTVVITNVHTWAEIHSRRITKQAIGNSYIRNIHDAAGLVSALKQAMLTNNEADLNKKS